MQQKDNMENREKGGSQNGSLWRTTHWEVKTNDLDPEEILTSDGINLCLFFWEFSFNPAFIDILLQTVTTSSTYS